MRRRYTAANDSERCKADRKPLRDGSGARCMRRAAKDGYCRQHAKPARFRLSGDQKKVLTVLDSYIPLTGSDERGWKSTRLFNPLTVRSLIARQLVEASSSLPFMLKNNLDEMTVKITTLGIDALHG